MDKFSFLLLLVVVVSCGVKKEKKQKEFNERAASLNRSFMTITDSLPYTYKFKDINNILGGGFAFAINDDIVEQIVDPNINKEIDSIIDVVDSLNKVVETRNIYEALGTKYDEKFWNEDDGAYVTHGGYSYNANRMFDINDNIKLISLAKEDIEIKEAYYLDMICSNFIFMTIDKWTAEPIDRIEIDFKKLYHALDKGTGSLVIKKDGIYLNLDGKETTYKITEEGKFVKM